MMQNLQKYVEQKNTKFRGLAMQLDAAVWMVIVAIIVAAVVVGAVHMTNEARFATARLEMDQLRSAVLQYEAYTETTFDGNWGNLFNTITDASGDTHKALLQAKGRWSAGTPKDPWGNDYIFNGADASNRTITCTHDDETVTIRL